MNTLRILIVADDPLARAGLAMLLAGQADCAVVGQLSAEAVGSADLDIYHPDVILWDLGWDPVPNLDLMAELSNATPPVVALLSVPTRAAEVWAAGPRGLLPRDTVAAGLNAALAAVAQGLVVIDGDLSAALLPSGEQAPATAMGDLTPREQEVLQLLAEGLPNKAIASQLNISEHTVKFHVNAIMGKLGAQSRTEAVTRATRAGLILL